MMRRGLPAAIKDRLKEYEYKTLEHDAFYADIITAVNLFKEFIIKNELVIYGGTAIDYALRARGDAIYSDEGLKIPDLDVYSPTSVKHAYEFADILYAAGFKGARAIVAKHTETMRVDAGDNHFVADISYFPPEYFKQLPWVENFGMRSVHPDYQRVDLHSSTAFLFDNPPNEVVFDRLKKDIVRFGKLDAAYPMACDAEVVLKPTQVSLDFRHYVLGGFAAYSALYQTALSVDPKIADDPHIVKAEFEVGGEHFRFSARDQTLELLHHEPAALKWQMDEYEPFLNLLPETYRVTTDENVKLCIESTAQRYVSITVLEFGEPFRVAGVAYLLRQYIAQYHMRRITRDSSADSYLATYVSLMRLVAVCKDHPAFQIGVSVYGSQNIDSSTALAIQRARADAGKGEAPRAPTNYRPAKGSGWPEIQTDLPYMSQKGSKVINRN